MELLSYLIDLFLHLDKHLSIVIQEFGVWTYLLLFLIIFMETGLVVTPILPGDSLLFAGGTFAGLGWLNIALLFFLLSGAAILGDTVNYWLGHYIGPRAFSGNIRFLKQEYLERTHVFYEKHGGKTIILARFIPIIRTFAPFVAGIGAMTYSKFIVYNVIGGVVWVAVFSLGGYYFGNIPFVQRNFTFVIMGIILVSLLPPFVEYIKTRLERQKSWE
ncbi:MAG: DedA family protein [Chloroflexota bacterium]